MRRRSTGADLEVEFSRAVLEASAERMRLALYAFEAGLRARRGLRGRPTVRVPVRVWRLKPGRYVWETRDLRGVRLAGGEFEISNVPQVVEVEAPGRREVRIEVRPTVG